MNNRTKKLFALGMIISLSLGQAQIVTAEPTTKNREARAGKILGTAVGGGLSLYGATLLGLTTWIRSGKARKFIEGTSVLRDTAQQKIWAEVEAGVSKHYYGIAAKYACMLGLGSYVLYKTWKPAPKPSTENQK